MTSVQHHYGVGDIKQSTPIWRMGTAYGTGANSRVATGNNLGALREARGWKRPELAKRMGTTPQQIERLEKGQRRLTHDWIVKAAEALGVTASDIIAVGTDLPSPSTVDHLPTRDASADDDTVALTSLDLSYSMGPGTELESYIESEPIRFDPVFLRRISRAPYHRLKLARGVGDSMLPTLLAGDVVMIDTTQTRLNMSDRVWAVAINGAAAIKRLRVEKGGRIAILSDNPAVSDYVADADDIVIHGRVIWFGREL